MSHHSGSNMFFSDHGEVDSGSETDGEFLEDILPLPTPERPTFPAAPVLGNPTSLATIIDTVNRAQDASFRPQLDIPRARASNTRFRNMRPVKPEDVTFEPESDTVESVTKDKPQTRSRKRASSHQPSRIEKPAAPRRVSHNPSLGLSKTKGAVDCRERKAVEAEYRGRVAAMIDRDIIEEVEEEGGITPNGRLHKATVRMLERGEKQREELNALVSSETATANAELLARALKAEAKGEAIKSESEAFVKRLE